MHVKCGKDDNSTAKQTADESSKTDAKSEKDVSTSKKPSGDLALQRYAQIKIIGEFVFIQRKIFQNIHYHREYYR